LKKKRGKTAMSEDAYLKFHQSVGVVISKLTRERRGREIMRRREEGEALTLQRTGRRGKKKVPSTKHPLYS